MKASNSRSSRSNTSYDTLFLRRVAIFDVLWAVTLISNRCLFKLATALTSRQQFKSTTLFPGGAGALERALPEAGHLRHGGRDLRLDPVWRTMVGGVSERPWSSGSVACVLLLLIQTYYTHTLLYTHTYTLLYTHTYTLLYKYRLIYHLFICYCAEVKLSFIVPFWGKFSWPIRELVNTPGAVGSRSAAPGGFGCLAQGHRIHGGGYRRVLHNYSPYPYMCLPVRIRSDLPPVTGLTP